MADSVLNHLPNRPQRFVVGQDKARHFVAAAALSALATDQAQQRGLAEGPSRARALGVVIVLGSAKEAHDTKKPNSFWSWRDMAWNILGAVVGNLLVWQDE
jgi:putative lipoprotein